MTTQNQEMSDEERAFIHRVMAARALGQDFASIIVRTGVTADLAIIASMTTLSICLSQLAKINKDAAQSAVDQLIVDFGGLCKGLGLSIDGEGEQEQVSN